MKHEPNQVAPFRIRTVISIGHAEFLSPIQNAQLNMSDVVHAASV